MEKTNPVLILTKCVLHMCGASVSAVGPKGGSLLLYGIEPPWRPSHPAWQFRDCCML